LEFFILQCPDDNRRSAGRPSLLTPTQQADAERNRILSNLEGGKIAVKPAPKRGLLLWAGIGLGALALIGAAVAWVADGEAGDAATPGVVAADPPAAAKAREAAPADAFASLPVAAIHDEAGAAPAKPQSLKEMLSAAPAAAPKSGTEVLSKALESPPAAKPHADVLSKALESKPAGKARAESSAKSAPASKKDVAQARIERKHAAAQAKAKAKAKALAKAQDKTNSKAQGKALAKAPGKAPAKTLASDKPAARAKAKAEPDSDVTLLQALVAHAQANPEPPSKPSIEAQLKQCEQTGKAASADACRARVCIGRGGVEGPCKARAAKALSAS
jgi:hypothetical protein